MKSRTFSTTRASHQAKLKKEDETNKKYHAAESGGEKLSTH